MVRLPRPRNASRLPSCSGIRVLVVNDDQDTRDLMEQLLVYVGATVRVATTAREVSLALDEADVVVTDDSLPGDTAVWLLERAHQRPRPVPVILVTSYDVHVNAPFARVLRKPIDLWALCREIQAAVERV